MKPYIRCAICEKPIRGKTVVLEYNRRTNTWHKPGSVPSQDSQGGFEVGAACARRALKESEFS